MRITRGTLFKIAEDTVARRTRVDRNLLSIYLHGSLLTDEPLLGGTTDIDLVFIHNDPPLAEREIQPLTEEVHLDIAHHSRNDYRRTRELRLHPWMGPVIVSSKILYDPQHFMDFTQASVGGQFNQPEFVLARARGQAEHARQIWLGLHSLAAEPALEEVSTFLRGVEHAANAIASLNGPPLTERRLLLNFLARAEAAGRPGLYRGLLGLLGGSQIDPELLKSWLPAWESTYEAVPPADAPPRLHPARKAYYRWAFEAILASSQPADVLWPFVRTWTQLVKHLPQGAAECQEWQGAFNHLGLLGADFRGRIAAMDVYLDTIEETLDEWAREHGVN
jgi:hypothetical protein